MEHREDLSCERHCGFYHLGALAHTKGRAWAFTFLLLSTERKSKGPWDKGQYFVLELFTQVESQLFQVK